MAKIVPGGRSGKLTKVTWDQEIGGKLRSVSKQLDTETNAAVFKSLVEGDGSGNDRWPSYVKLLEHDLMEFGFDVSPMFVLKLRMVAFNKHFSDKDKVELICELLENF